jgi:hypothetical protein
MVSKNLLVDLKYVILVKYQYVKVRESSIVYLSYYSSQYHLKTHIDTLVILSKYACFCMVYKPKWHEKQNTPSDTQTVLVSRLHTPELYIKKRYKSNIGVEVKMSIEDTLKLTLWTLLILSNKATWPCK